MLVVYNFMNNLVQLWENGNLLSNGMSYLIFHRYSVQQYRQIVLLCLEKYAPHKGLINEKRCMNG